jgi:hypothetical protein
VIVLRPERAVAGVEGVWVSAPDSAARAAAAIGDSIRADSVARAVSATTAALRQRLLDSLKAAGALAPPAVTGPGAQPAGAQQALPSPAPAVVVPTTPRTVPRADSTRGSQPAAVPAAPPVSVPPPRAR